MFEVEWGIYGCTINKFTIARKITSNRNITYATLSAMTVKVEDLPGVEPYLISKLKRAGIQSVLDLAVYIPHELVLGGDYNEGNGIGS